MKLPLYNTEKWHLIANLQGQVLSTQDGDDWVLGEKKKSLNEVSGAAHFHVN